MVSLENITDPVDDLDTMFFGYDIRLWWLPQGVRADPISQKWADEYIPAYNEAARKAILNNGYTGQLINDMSGFKGAWYLQIYDRARSVLSFIERLEHTDGRVVVRGNERAIPLEFRQSMRSLRRTGGIINYKRACECLVEQCEAAFEGRDMAGARIMYGNLLSGKYTLPEETEKNSNSSK
jgi:hypothetical protein